MPYSSARQGQLGVNVVERVVLQMGWRWQQLDAANDDGVDGLIFVEENGFPNGQVIFVQVKCHSSKTDKEGRICVSFDTKKLARNFEKWRRIVGAAILVHVSPKHPYDAHWVNLLEPGAIDGSRVYIRGDSIFDGQGARSIRRLCGNLHRDILKPQINTSVEDYAYVSQNVRELQVGAREYYRSIGDGCARLGKEGPQVRFTAEGWRHITRRSRHRLTQIQSLLLLGCVVPLIRHTPEGSLEPDRKFSDGSRLVVTRAAVTFPFRQTCMVKLLLRRRGEPGAYCYNFYSIYEVRRKRDVLGRR